MKPLVLACLLLPVALLTACADIQTSCEPSGAVTPICGVQMPEDIAVLPDEGGLIVSQYGDNGKHSGELLWYQPGPQAEFITLATSGNVDIGAEKADNWGQPGCTAPDMLSPHGIHLSERGDLLQILVVNHGAREQVLMYEVNPSADSQQAPSLSWRGCVTFPEIATLNDVAALPDGGFAVTHMYPRENELLGLIKVVLGLSQGHVWRWVPGQDIEVLAGTQAKVPNGIEVSPDGNSLWINNYTEGELRQYDLDTSTVIQAIPVPNIDNSAWLPDGRLLLASHDSLLDMAGCFGVTEGSCAAGYSLVAVDTETGKTKTIFQSSPDQAFGPATVAVLYRGVLVAGSFSGDRMAIIDIEL